MTMLSRMLGPIGAVCLLGAAPVSKPQTAPSSEAAEQLAKLTPVYQMANGCSAATDAARTAAAMPLLSGLAAISYPLDTRSTMTRRYFEQGVALLYGFEYPKAQRSFAAARATDPDCAMCLYGEALAIGPYINSGAITADKIAGARALTGRALASAKLTERERALVSALHDRYAPAPPRDESGVHAARFATAMGEIARRWPDDNFIAVPAGEAAMEVEPWD